MLVETAMFPGLLLWLAIEAFIWGWIILGWAGIWLLVTLLWAKRKAIRTIVGILAIVLAACWAKSVETLTWGVKYQTLRTQSGDMEVEAWHRGVMSHSLVIRRRDGRKCGILVPVPKRATLFWIQEGKTIGVLAGTSRLIVDAELFLDVNTSLERPLTPEEKTRYPYKRVLTPEEEKLFEAAERASTEQ